VFQCLAFKIETYAGAGILLDYNNVHPEGELLTICCRANSLRRCKSFVLESALVIRELVGHVAR
jgi:hypothetical protein